MKNEIRHYALYGEEFSLHNEWLQELLKGEVVEELAELRGKKGVLLSDVVLDEFIEKDARHGRSELVQGEGRGIRTFSSGERRKALLDHLINQEPDFLVLDDPFASLDKKSVMQLRKRFQELSEAIPLIQLFKRREDLLTCISHVLFKEKEKTTIYSLSDFQKNVNRKENTKFVPVIPPAPIDYKGIPEVLVEMKNVSVKYEGKPILRNINWKILKGEFWKLAGPNGSGKSTLLSMIYGDNPKAYGQELFLFEKKKGSGESVWEIKRKIGYFSPALTELFKRTHTAEQMLISGLVDSVGLYQEPTEEQNKLAKDWLKTLQLTEEGNTPFINLSLLQQRLLLVARAMIKHPPLLILDEPTTSLDEKSAILLTRLINYISERTETAIIYVSHRHEKGLNSQFIFNLFPSENGSVGKVLNTRKNKRIN
ncbi:ATP-binding cassette domain-containing protein [Antarcticibacterium sp. 1MA-6-2]|uniref:ATP-binding cassette domain-containing protein n=1 Tax=Antarcticibacterium sp. 1MA-6-2 TaxID=2908210 RepID=UPI001F446D5B|nr:ATP-binding cassette domain-containing protein [Antarcticibacterium sp. 1MA-6-2]UJH91035.1 ATP-binding cassette domain-containing protein [Antarcticibacterium sp. 1MA-6-2]